jgi:hypothetical protein
VVFVVIGQAVFNALAPRWFHPVKGGINYEQVMWAGVVGAACAVVGLCVGLIASSGSTE